MKLKIAVFLSVLFAFAAAPRAAESYTNAYEAIALFTKVLEEVHRSYVDTNESGYDSLIRHAMTGMLQDLDPYSQFMDEEFYEDLKDDTAGRFSGVGLVVSMKDGLLTVVSPMEDTPAFRAGLLSGDIIVEIDGAETRTMMLAEAVKKMRGEAGTVVKLKAARPSTHAVKEHILTREEIAVASVKDAKLFEDSIGYIRITQFNEPTAEDLKTKLDDFMSNVMASTTQGVTANGRRFDVVGIGRDTQTSGVTFFGDVQDLAATVSLTSASDRTRHLSTRASDQAQQCHACLGTFGRSRCLNRSHPHSRMAGIEPQVGMCGITETPMRFAPHRFRHRLQFTALAIFT